MPQDTSQFEVKSYTLLLHGEHPETVCASCPHALWHLTATDEYRCWCKLMFVLVDHLLLTCDGNQPPKPEPEVTEEESEQTTSETESSDGEETSENENKEQIDMDDLPDPNSPDVEETEATPIEEDESEFLPSMDYVEPTFEEDEES